MALAPFFDKAALAAAAVLGRFDHRDFAATLTAHRVGVAFDDDAVASREGRITLRLGVNLLARLFPTLVLHAAGARAAVFRDALAEEVRRINPAITIRVSPEWPSQEDGSPVASRGVPTDASTDAPSDAATDVPLTACLCVGTFVPDGSAAPTAAYRVFLGSEGWDAALSTAHPVGSGQTRWPFGAAAAACLGVANVFRYVFAAQLGNVASDEDVVLCTRTLQRATTPVSTWAATRTDRTDRTADASDGGAAMTGPVDFGALTLAGAGAIGEAFLYTLRHVVDATGSIDVIDDETVDATNPQRYVLTAWSDVGRPKVTVAHRFWTGAAPAAAGDAAPPADGLTPDPDVRTDVTLVQHPQRWGAFLAARPWPWRLERVVVALDSARDRIAVQAALPRWIANAWTQPGDFGVSQHAGLGTTPCLACLYVPLTAAGRHEDEVVADAIRLPHDRLRVRELLATNHPVPADVLAAIAVAHGLSADALDAFAGRPLRAFYSEAVCGGVMMALQARERVASELAHTATASGAASEADLSPADGGRDGGNGAGANGAGANGAGPDGSATDRAGADGHGAPGTDPTRPDVLAATAAAPSLDRGAMVPMAFQSAFAGVLLAAQVTADALGMPGVPPGHKGVLNTLRPLPPLLRVPVAPHPSGRCLCQDADFQQAYAAMWQGAELAAGTADVTPAAPDGGVS